VKKEINNNVTGGINSIMSVDIRFVNVFQNNRNVMCEGQPIDGKHASG
jgi:hypothetical protein